MLPKIHYQAYKKLLTALVTSRDHLAEQNLEISPLKKDFQVVKDIFQNNIINLSNDELDPSLAASWQSIQTELHRALRLLETDIMFLSSSVKSATASARLSTVKTRLEQAIAYCQLLLNAQ